MLQQNRDNIKSSFEVWNHLCKMLLSASSLSLHEDCRELFEPLWLQSAKGSKHHLWLWPGENKCSVCLVEWQQLVHLSTASWPALVALIRRSSLAFFFSFFLCFSKMSRRGKTDPLLFLTNSVTNWDERLAFQTAALIQLQPASQQIKSFLFILSEKLTKAVKCQIWAIKTTE